MPPWIQKVIEATRDDLARLALPEMGFDPNGPVWVTLVSLGGNELVSRRVCRNIGTGKWATLSIPFDGPAEIYAAFSGQPAGPLRRGERPLVPMPGCTVDVTPKFNMTGMSMGHRFDGPDGH